MRARIWIAIVGAAFGLIVLACASSGDATTPSDREFIRHCRAEGKVPHVVHRGDSTSRSCVPPPTPAPVGWQ